MAVQILAIDPGNSGGFAWFDAAGAPNAEKIDGKTERDIADRLMAINTAAPTFCYIEKVGANRGGAGRRQGASSMFTFGRSYGFLRGILIATPIPFEAIRPQKWLPAMGLRGIADETQTEKKNRHKSLAQQLFPQITITHAIADALLLAEYGRRMRLQPQESEK